MCIIINNDVNTMPRIVAIFVNSESGMALRMPPDAVVAAAIPAAAFGFCAASIAVVVKYSFMLIRFKTLLLPPCSILN